MYKKLKRGLKALSKGNFYSFRREIIWAEGNYKRGMISRVQKQYSYNSFVETGTYMGDTPLKLCSLFKRIYTVELDPILYRNAKKKLAGHQNIECIYGDSQEILPSIIQKLDGPAIFWLDGHYSGLNTALGVVKAPLLHEINVIARSNIKTHIIIVDDISDFSISEGNVALSEVLAAIEKINSRYKFYFDYDMLFALPFEVGYRDFWKKIAYPIVIR